MNTTKDIIQAWLDGKEIQVKAKLSEHWVNKESYGECIENKADILFSPDFYDYRIKPEEVVKYVTPEHFEFAMRTNERGLLTKPYLHDNPNKFTDHHLKLTFIDNILTKAEVI
jgi:hypothetical protein